VTVLIGTNNGVVAVDDDGEVSTELVGSIGALRANRLGCWATVNRHSVARRDPDGSWTMWPLMVDASITAVLPQRHGALVGTDDARLWTAIDGAVSPVFGFDVVPGRDTWHAVGSRVPYVRSLSSPASDAALLASVHVGGIPRSANCGQTWAPTVDVDADVHEVCAHPDDTSVVMAAAAVGLLRSDDGGATWAPATRVGLHASYLRALAFPTGAVIVSASDGPFGDQVALYRCPLAGGALERCAGGLPEWLPAIVDTGALAASGSRVAAGTAGRVFVSDDAGSTWRLLVEGLDQVRAVALVDAPRHPRRSRRE
jgi:hypothetical protein